ncbi:MAG: hypothetical protein FLDDKLPJ_02810 [Phycisphaerae bacterium]|nr:hypothetical protein [Phycisphaerae bacterium]
MLSRRNALVTARVSFAFETTLAARSLAPWLQARMSEAYETNLVYLWLPSADMAVERVEGRVRRGGHNIPESTVRRRYSRSLHNLVNLFIPIVSAFRLYDKAGDRPRLITRGWGGKATLVRDKDRWHDIQEHGHDSTD